MAYQLHRLGWHNFQQLCLAIAREVLGQTVVSFLDTNDGGRDGAFEGTWTPQKGETIAGHFVIQCKHSNKDGHSLKPSDLKDEVSKAQRLVVKGLCDVYVLMTNATVSGRTEEKVRDEYLAVGVKHFVCLSGVWISDQIQLHKELRMAVPRLYGLGDLGQILDERAYDQAKALLASLQDDLSKVVLTGTYHRAAEALRKHAFVLLLGEPAAGKTTIAATLSMASIDLWGCSMMKLEEPAQVVEHWNPHEPSQFFWIDDAFGATQYEPSLAYRWNSVFPQVQAALKRGAKIIMTSRDYVYNRARHDLKASSFPLINESQVAIDVKDLSSNEKQQILYNHIKLGNQPKQFRSSIKPYLGDIAGHGRFVPETARRLGNTLFTKGLQLDLASLLDFTDRREEHLLEVISGLDSDSKAAIAMIYMRNGKLPSPITLSPAEKEALERFGSNLGGCTRALEALRESLVHFAVLDGAPVWIVKHPTIADAFSRYLVQSHELMGIYLRGAPLEKLMNQVTCGDMSTEEAIIVPPSLYDIVLDRIDAPSRSQGKNDLDWFLTYRCTKDFLRAYLKRNPSSLGRISRPGLMLSATSETGLAIRLHECELLPEGYRKKLVKTVVEYAIDGFDGHVFHDKDLRSILTKQENAELITRARTKLIPKLNEVRWDAESNHRSGGDPQESMAEFFQLLDDLEKEFQEDNAIQAKLESERQLAYQWIGEHEEPTEEISSRQRLSTNEKQSVGTNQSRSIFDDVDL